MGTDTAPENGQLPDTLSYLVMYVYGMLKSHVISPIVQAPPNSPYLDSIADLSF